ncbi:MAG: four helix bundle protein [Saprospiraceae bacterium]|jgi:four helix bundle protein|nr:four helix bundle protein [Saprospiraceae bacterium]MBL0027376.1 four helix bundle protein [Saprospiraceae bacterium]
MKVGKFEDLLVWQEGLALAREIYILLKTCNGSGFRDQIRRVALSIPSNNAEGYDSQTYKEFIQFMYIAKGSCAEVRIQLYSLKAQIISKGNLEILMGQTNNISTMLTKEGKGENNYTLKSKSWKDNNAETFLSNLNPVMFRYIFNIGLTKLLEIL